MRLTGGAGTGKKIIKNWERFSFKLTEKLVEENEEHYFFDVKFDNQMGNMTVVIKNNGTWFVDESTLINMKSFDRPLGAYNDATAREGLYEVGKRMLEESNLKVI